MALNLPCFFVRTPQDFIRFTRAGKRLPVINQPGPRLALYLATHREALRATRAFLGLKPPASYACVSYNGLHAFRWVNVDGNHYVRYSWLPEAGEATISTGEAKHAGPGLSPAGHRRAPRTPARPLHAPGSARRRGRSDR